MSNLKLDGVDLFYREAGAGIPVLLIHGTGANADLWGGAFETLAKSFRVIAYDRRGYSRSVHPAVKDYHLHTQDAAAIIKALGVGPVIVVGWSAGGIIALDLAIKQPELVAALILDEPPLHAKKHPDFSLIRTLVRVSFQRRTNRAELAAQTFLRYALSATNGGSAFDRWPDEWQQVIRANSPAILAELDAGTGEYLTNAQISNINCPVTLVWGELSQPFLVNAMHRLTRLLPQARQVRLAGTAHALHIEKQTEFVKAVQHTTELTTGANKL